MQLVAYALRAEYEGTVEQDLGEGPVEVPKFGGGLLAVGDGDFHVRDELERGGGAIAVKESDQLLIGLLDAYPPLKRAEVPEGAKPVSPYARRSAEDLQHAASLRGFERYAGDSKAALSRRLEAHDEALYAGDGGLARRVQEGDDAAIAEALGERPGDGLERLRKDDLRALAEANGVAVADDATKDQIIEALRAAGVRGEG